MSEWLVVIDLQRAFGAPESPWHTPGFDAAAAGAQRLADAFAGRTVLTRFVPPRSPPGAWRDYYERWDFARAPAAAELWSLVEPWADAPALDFPTFSKWGPSLTTRVGEHPTLVLCGVSTDCCVLATALAAVDAGAHVRVVADACAAERALHNGALQIMDRRAPQLALSSVEAELARTRA